MAFDPDAYLAAAPAPAFNPDAYLAQTSSGVPGPRQGTLAKIGTGLASLGDVTIGGILPMAGQGVQAVVRPFTTPQRAEEIGGAVSSAVDKPFGKFFGVTEAPAYKQEASRQLMEYIGANVNKGADWISKNTGLPVEDVRNMLNTAGLLAPAAVKGVKTTAVKAIESPLGQQVMVAQNELGTNIANTLVQPVLNRAVNKAQVNLAKSYENAPQIEAAQKANQLGIALNPAVSNPTKMNKAKSVIAGNQNLDTKLASANEPRWANAAKQEMGLPENTVLDSEAFNKARDLVSGPYNEVRKVPVLAPDQKVFDSLKGLMQDEALIGGEGTQTAINNLVTDAAQKINSGLSGDLVVKNIRQMRKEAQDVFKSQKAGSALTPEQVATAETKMGIANALESLIESNIQDPKALDAFRKARTAMAKTYAYEAATDLNTGKLDPMAIAKITAKDNNLTGTIADIGKIAGNFPDIAKVGAPSAAVLPTLTRSGLGGTIGYGIGTLFGAPLAGSIAGAGVGGLVGAVGAKRISTPAYQAAHAVPIDYRRPVNALTGTGEINYGPNQMVPFDYSQQTFTPPNFTIVGEQYGPRVTPVAPNTLNALPAPSAEGTMGGIATERARAAAMSRTLGQQAETQQAAAEAAARQPARGGAVLEVDPVTGKITVGAEGGRNITPATQIIESTGKNLQGAADLLAAGKSPALMTAEQKIAWDKTKVDLAEVVPGMKTLGDKAIAAKMQDRAWVQDSLDKARQKARAFDDIAARAANERLRQDALMKREQMMDLAEQLQDALGSRPVKRGGQGPKTRAFQRNALAPEQEIQNALATRIDLTGMANK